MRVNDRDRNDPLPSDSSALAPLGSEGSGRCTNRLGFGQLLDETGHNISRISDPRLILRFVRGEPRLRFSWPVNCQTSQSPASMKRSAAFQRAGASSASCAAFASSHSPETLPPKLRKNSPPRALIRSAQGCADWCFQSFT